MLKELFYSLCEKYSVDIKTTEAFWEEIEKAYNHKKRFYHTLDHIENLISQLSVLKTEIENWDAALFASFYHDIVYNAVKKDNEEKSAELAVKRLSKMGIDNLVISDCGSLILATRKHELSTKGTINYFTDADLSILGAEWNIYKEYADNVRKEYAVFPDIIYRPGRRKVLEHFLSMKQIFKTTYFFNRLEQNAKNNLTKELESLA